MPVLFQILYSISQLQSVPETVKKNGSLGPFYWNRISSRSDLDIFEFQRWCFPLEGVDGGILMDKPDKPTSPSEALTRILADNDGTRVTACFLTSALCDELDIFATDFPFTLETTLGLG